MLVWILIGLLSLGTLFLGIVLFRILRSFGKTMDNWFGGGM